MSPLRHHWRKQAYQPPRAAHWAAQGFGCVAAVLGAYSRMAAPQAMSSYAVGALLTSAQEQA